MEIPTTQAIETSLPLPATATVPQLEELLENASSRSTLEGTLQIDLTRTEYLDLVAAVYLIALASQRAHTGSRTVFRLPESKKVRDFLRVWRFPMGLRAATGISFVDLVDEADAHYFGENVSDDDQTYAGRLLHHGVDRLLSNRFFAITPFHLLPGRSHTRLVFDESRRWEQGVIRSVLRKHLRGPDGYLASRIVFEAMSNALRHPAATLLLTASKFEFRNSSTGGHFTLVYWDNGDSMIDTLKRAIMAGRPTRSEFVPELSRNYSVVIDPGGGSRRNVEVPGDFAPSPATEDELVFLSTCLPGITSDPEGRHHVVHPLLEASNPLHALPGMGLPVLLNTALEMFAGSVALRSQHLFMNIKALGGARYRAKIRRFQPWMPAFLGNMITIRIPIRSA